MKINSDLIEKADNALRTTNIVSENGTYDNRFKGYISSFGASIVQSGLLPTVIFYEKEETGEAKDRPKVVQALIAMLNNNQSGDNPRIPEKLSKYIIDKKCGNEFIEEVTDCMVAMKLALRMYRSIKNDNNIQLLQQ